MNFIGPDDQPMELTRYFKTRAEVARYFGCHYDTVESWAHGKSKNLMMKNFFTLTATDQPVYLQEDPVVLKSNRPVIKSVAIPEHAAATW
jgi:hypothetical protein